MVQPCKNLEFIDTELQSHYRSGVSMLLYLTKYSRSDMSKNVTELSKCMDGATIGTCLELLRIIKFIWIQRVLVSKCDLALVRKV